MIPDKYKPIVQNMARAGCASIGIVYVFVGVMAMISFFQAGEDAADEDRIMDVILGLPLGEVLIGGIILGLVGYIIWRIFEALTDPYGFGKGVKGIGKRLGVALSGIGYGIIAFSALEALFEEGNGNGNGEEEQQMMVSQ
ncbi:MAG: DUF1206 domain-containing protein, partial [Cytophagaceae bacterium]